MLKLFKPVIVTVKRYTTDRWTQKTHTHMRSDKYIHTAKNTMAPKHSYREAFLFHPICVGVFMCAGSDPVISLRVMLENEHGEQRPSNAISQ